MNLKACTFERLAFISLRFGRGAQVGKTSLFEVEFIYGASVDVGSIQFFIWYASGPGIPPKPSIFEEDHAFFLTMQSKIVRRLRFEEAFLKRGGGFFWILDFFAKKNQFLHLNETDRFQRVLKIF